MTFALAPRRAVYVDVAAELAAADLARAPAPLTTVELAFFEDLDLFYRSLVAVMFNYVPTSGHPGGSISAGRFVSMIVFETMRYDLRDPKRRDADILSFAAGHKALGLYAISALRNEVARVADADLLPTQTRQQLRLEDLLGFRHNPISDTRLFASLEAKALDGHPTPSTPFVRLATGASGVGVAASVGLAWGAADLYGADAPTVHIIEGEGGMTPGRVAEAMAAAGTASLGNVVMHLDWNQSSIDSDRVCREGDQPGDYVQWNPMELAYLNDWNVIYVADGFDFQQIAAAQRRVATIANGQPTCIVYRTVKGWRYGIEGRKSHGAGHKLCSQAFYDALAPLEAAVGSLHLPGCAVPQRACRLDQTDGVMEDCLWEALTAIRRAIEGRRRPMADFFAARLRLARERVDAAALQPREGAPQIEALYEAAAAGASTTPPMLALAAGIDETLRGALGKVLLHLNQESGGAILAGAADLLGSTSISVCADGFPAGFWNAQGNPGARLLSLGGICEDAMCGILGGLSTFGAHVGAGSSYGAFIAPLGHIASRLHAIGNQARQEVDPGPFRPYFLICAHAGLKTGEDGPTHADPQPLQLLQENYPRGTLVTLTPWEPQEMWPLVSAALVARPAVIAPFVTRPAEHVLDREQLGLAPASAARKGVYRLRAAHGPSSGTLVLQGSAVAYAFVEETLPRLRSAGIELDVYYVASAELFDLNSADEQAEIFPEAQARQAMGITDFTLPTLYRWVTSERGRQASLYPFRGSHFLGSGQGHRVLAEAGLDGEGQFRGIMSWLASADGLS